MSLRPGRPDARTVGNFLADYLGKSLWGKNDCLRMAQAYLALWGVRVELPEWSLYFGNEQEAMAEAVERFGSLSKCFCEEIDRMEALEIRISNRRLEPPAVGVALEHPLRLDRLPSRQIMDGGLAVLAWDGWYARLEDGLVRVDGTMGRVWVPKRS